MAEHRLLPESQLHEVKGASTAPANSVLVSNGNGTTTFKEAGAADLVTLGNPLQASTTDAVNPTAADVVTPIPLSAAAAADATSSTAGVITAVTAGIFLIDGLFTFTGADNATFYLKPLLNGNNYATPVVATIQGVNGVAQAKVTLQVRLEVGDTISFVFVRDSVGGATGGLASKVPTLGTFGNLPSAAVNVVKIKGSF